MFKPKVEYNFYFSIFYISIFFISLMIYGFDKYWIYSYVIHFIIGSFGIAFGYHKTIIHNSVETFSLVRRFAALIALFSNTGSAITWATSHYLHHAYPDTEYDPHSPMEHRYRILLGFYNTDAILAHQKKVFVAVRKIAKDSFLVHLHKNYYLYLLSYYLFSYVVGGFKGLLFFGLIPSGISFYSIILTNYFNHGKLGYRNFETPDLSLNVWFLFFFTFGENWHNNHHRYPSAKSNRIRWWEIDLSYVYCYLFDINNYQKLIFYFNKLKKMKQSKDRDYIY